MRSVVALLSGALILFACGSDESAETGGGSSPALRHAVIADGPHAIAVIRVRDLGSIRIELLPEVAPKTVANYEKLADSGFYDGTQFHRVIPGFMIQGGDPNTKGNDPRTYGKGGPGYKIPDEFSDLSHTRGTVSMANLGYPNTGASQFFIVQGNATHLDGRHTAFGRVVEGMDVVDAITKLQIDTFGRYGPRDRPYPVPAVVDSIRIERAGASAAESEAAPGKAGAAGNESEEKQERPEPPKGPGELQQDTGAGEVFGS
jgi:peptidyl-prolyl cis-trans isomerase B (cyclophilin B)